ncbi:MAG: hypothetical protein Q4G69_01980 [Planctomycetia bacterium]|nr:hypothetical protein [Planctomycetia bacterium]
MNERTKKYWILMIFFIFGPLLTLIVLGVVLHRRMGAEARSIAESLSASTGQTFQIRKARFIRPGQVDFLGIECSDPQKRESLLFCPIVRIVRKKGSPSSSEIAHFFSNRKGLTENSTSSLENEPVVPLNIALKKDDRSQNSFFEYGNAVSFLENIPAGIKEYQFWSIPDLYIRSSRSGEIRDRFVEWIRQQKDLHGKLIFFSIDRVSFLYSDANFKKEIADYTIPSRFSSFQGEKKGRLARGIESADASPESIRRWIAQQNTNERSLDLVDIHGLFIDSAKDRRCDFGFYFSELPITRPAAISLFLDKAEKKDLYFCLDANSSPFPSSFASLFCDLFYLGGQKSWFTGFLAGEWSSPDKRISSASDWRIQNFHFRFAELDPFIKRATSVPLEGTIADFFLENASIRNGIFSGSGLLFLIKGNLDINFLIRLKEHLHLILEPENALSNQFANNQVPYDEFAIKFSMLPQGIRFDSSFPKKIIGCLNREGFQIGIYLPEDCLERIVPYPDLLSILAVEEGTAPFWTRFYRDAMNHLPVHDENQKKK